MATGRAFAKWGLGLFLFGIFLSFGVIAHYCIGSRWPTGALFLRNITLWWGCPWTLCVAAIQVGGLGMVALGLTVMVAARLSANAASREHGHASLVLCVTGLLGVFAVGYPGYFVADAVWPDFYYAPVAAGKNIWLIGQALFIAIYLAGAVTLFAGARHALDEVTP